MWRKNCSDALGVWRSSRASTSRVRVLAGLESMVPWRRTREPGAHARPAVLVLGALSPAAPSHTGNPALDSRVCVLSLLQYLAYSLVALYAPVRFLIWAATRFGPRGASSALSLIALLSMVHVAGGQGLLLANLAPQNVLFVQLFLAVISVPVLFVAILMEERSAVETRLRESRKKLTVWGWLA